MELHKAIASCEPPQRAQYFAIIVRLYVRLIIKNPGAVREGQKQNVCQL